MASLARLFRPQSVHSARAEPSTSEPPSPPSSPSPPAVQISNPSFPSSLPADGEQRPLPHRGYSLAVPQAGAMLPSFHQQQEQTAGEGKRSQLRQRRSRETMRSAVGRSVAGSAVSAAASASPIDFHDLVQIYQIVSNRRGIFDTLLWTVPSTSFAAHSFLFQTALAGDTSQSARIISMALSILITVLTLQLFTRQLQAEAADHAWLEDWEKRHGVDERDRAHGATWARYRSVLPPRARHFKTLAAVRGFTLWSNGMMIIGCVALGVLIASALDSTAFQNCQNN